MHPGKLTDTFFSYFLNQFAYFFYAKNDTFFLKTPVAVLLISIII